jgi:hypothetical protein
MAVIGSTAFAVLLWGTVLAVLAVFVYEVYAIGVEYGWLGAAANAGRRSGENR